MKVRIASAGTGKTASLVLRYLELIASGTPLRRIAGVTFTRKAADELRVRVAAAIEEVLNTGKHLAFVAPAGSEALFQEALCEIAGATQSTIHGFMAQCLRMTAPMLALDPDFFILGDWEALALFEEEWKTLGYLAQDPQHPLHGQASPELTEPLLHLFSRRSLAEVFEPAPGEANRHLLEVYQAVYAAYQARLGARLLSPSELERKALELARHPKAIARVLERVKVLLVDEYQDVNPLQGAFFAALEQAGLQIEVVGDPKQSIYAFRNADLSVFRKALRQGQPQPPLTRTYRHSRVLVRFLNALTRHLAEKGQGFGPEEAPPVEGVRPEQGRLEVHWVEGEAPLEELRRREARVLAERLQALSTTTPYSEMAVLVRSYKSVRFLEEAFSEARIPYVLLQGRGYYERQEVRDLYHALRAALQPRGLSLLAFLRSPFGVRASASPEGDRPLGEQRAKPVFPEGDRPLGARSLLRPEGDRPLGARSLLRPEGDRPLGARASASPEGDRPLGARSLLRPEGDRPFGQHTEAGSLKPLELALIEEVLQADDPLKRLAQRWPSVYERLEQIQARLRTEAPMEVLKFLIRSPLIAGRAYHEFLEPRARENVDALLFYFASRPPQTLEGLLERLELLSRQADAGDVPQSGEGVQILTIHRAKGLEWPLVAVFDLGRKNVHQGRPLYLGRENGDEGCLKQQVALPETPLFAAFKEQAKRLEEEEGYRLLYVAASRAREALLLTASASRGQTGGFGQVLEDIKLGPASRYPEQPDFCLRVWPYRPAPPVQVKSQQEALQPSPWVEARFAPEPFPPLFSPSAYKRLEAEPLPIPDPEEGEEVPGRARAIGTLVHYAIGQNWRPDNPEHLANLEAQEVMFPYGPDEREEIMAEVKELLERYWALLGRALSWPRDEDYAEFAVALPLGSTVWQGVIDRLYRVGGQWYLEDYKTDQEMNPEQYHVQLGVYLRAIRQAWQVEPQVRLVYLRFGWVIGLDHAILEKALEEIEPLGQQA